MVIRGGENVYCVEVEGVLFEHPDDRRRGGDRRAAPGARRGGRRGDRARAPGSTLTADDVRAHVAARLAGVQGARRTCTSATEPLPRNPAGKVLKRELRDELVG